MTAPGSHGQQQQRTHLAWLRTSLATCAVAALSVHHAVSRDWGAQTVPATLSVCVAILTLFATNMRGRQLKLGRNQAPRALVCLLAAMVTATTISAVIADLINN